MARVGINTGSTANDGTGDSLRAAGGIINSNFTEIYSQFGDGTNLSATWEKTSAGINSTANVGIGTTNPQFQLEVGYAGVADTSLFVHGNARVTGILTVGASSIVIDGSKNEVLIGTGVSLNGTTGIISATQVYAGGTLLTGGSGGSADSFWVEEGSTGITTTKNVGVATDSAPSALTVGGQSLFLGITTFRENVILSNPNSGASNNLNFGGDVYIDQSSGDTFTFQINTGSDTNTTDGSFVFRNTEPNTSPIPDFQLDALRIYTRGDYWNGMVRSYTDFHADQNAFVGGNLQVGAASTLIGVGNTLGSFKVGAGGTVISTSASGLVGIGSSVPSVELDVSGNVSVSSSVTAATFYGDGSNLSGVGAASTANVRTNTFAASGVSTFSDKVRILDDVEFHVGTNGVSGDYKFYHDSGNSYNIPYEDITGREARFISNLAGDSNAAFHFFKASTALARFSVNNVQLHSGGAVKFETTGGGINVTGHTETDTLQVSGISTLTGNTFVGSAVSIYASSGIVSATSFYGDGSGLTGVVGSGSGVVVQDSQTTVGTAGTIDFGTGLSVSTISVGIVTVTADGENPTEGSWTAVAGVLQNIDTITISSNNFKTVEYTLHINHNSGMQAQKVLAMQTGSAAYSQEYAIMYDDSLLVSIGASLSGGNFYLNATPETGVSGITTYRFTRKTIS